MNILNESNRKRSRAGVDAPTGYVATWLVAKWLDKTPRAITYACQNEKFTAFVKAGAWWISAVDVERYMKINNETIPDDLAELARNERTKKARDLTPDMFEAPPS